MRGGGYGPGGPQSTPTRGRPSVCGSGCVNPPRRTHHHEAIARIARPRRGRGDGLHTLGYGSSPGLDGIESPAGLESPAGIESPATVAVALLIAS